MEFPCSWQTGQVLFTSSRSSSGIWDTPYLLCPGHRTLNWLLLGRREHVWKGSLFRQSNCVGEGADSMVFPKALLVAWSTHHVLPTGMLLCLQQGLDAAYVAVGGCCPFPVSSPQSSSGCIPYPLLSSHLTPISRGSSPFSCSSPTLFCLFVSFCFAFTS